MIQLESILTSKPSSLNSVTRLPNIPLAPLPSTLDPSIGSRHLEQPLLKAPVDLPRREAPAPVVPLSCRHVHPGLPAQAEQVLHGDDGRPRNGHQGKADHCFVYPFRSDGPPEVVK